MASNVDIIRDQSEDGDELLSESNPIGASPNGNSPRLTKLPLLERLGKLPKRREIPWQDGKELPPEKSTESSRLQQRGACLLSTRGNVAQIACSHCIKTNNGRFKSCIALPPWFQGACCACVFTSKGNRCSLRVQTIGKADGRMLRHAVDDGLSDEPRASKKRKMQSSSAGIHPSSTDESTDLDALLQTQITQDSSRGPSKARASPEEIDSSKIQIQLSPTGTKVQQILEQVNSGHERPSPTTVDIELGKSAEEMPMVIEHNKPLSTEMYETPYITKSSHSSNPSYYPPKDLPDFQHVSETPLETFRVIHSNIQRNFTPINVRPNKDNAPTPLIKTLPKASQKRIYALISGIQGGVHHLQDQLDYLKVSLGIEADRSENKT